MPEKRENNFAINKGDTKPFKTIDEQLDLLIDRGLIVTDRDKALNVLSRINYYRLSAYSLTCFGRSVRSQLCIIKKI